MIRIAIVDTYTLVRSGLRRLLADEPDMEVVAEVATAEAALRAARETRPDVVLLDLDARAMGGLECTRRLVRAVPETRVIVLGVHVEGPVPGGCLEVGASGYLTRDCSQEELIEALRAVRRGRRYLSAEVAQHMAVERLDPRSTPMGALTPREMTVLVLVSRGHDRRSISDQLCLSPKTVSTYRSRILRKLGATSDVELTHLSYRHGLIQPSGIGPA